MGLLPDTWNCGLRMHRECRERFPRHQLQRKPLVSNPGMHHGTCVTHVPWCMSGALACGGRGKRSRHSRRKHNPQFYVSGKRPMRVGIVLGWCYWTHFVHPPILSHFPGTSPLSCQVSHSSLSAWRAWNMYEIKRTKHLIRVQKLANEILVTHLTQ